MIYAVACFVVEVFAFIFGLGGCFIPAIAWVLERLPWEDRWK